MFSSAAETDSKGGVSGSEPQPAVHRGKPAGTRQPDGEHGSSVVLSDPSHF